MRENDLLVFVKRRVKTTHSKHGYGRYPNLVQDLEIVRPDQAWCSDITYIQLQREFIYLAIILDIFTRSLRGWELSRTLSSELALTALARALVRHQPAIHHSDQGIQYAAHGYVQRLQSLGVEISMAAAGQLAQNPYAERVIRTIKEEEVYLADYADFADAYHRIGHFIEDVYQAKRIHSSLGYLTPAEFEAAYWAEQTAALPPAGGGGPALVGAVSPPPGRRNWSQLPPQHGPKSVQPTGALQLSDPCGPRADTPRIEPPTGEGWRGQQGQGTCGGSGSASVRGDSEGDLRSLSAGARGRRGAACCAPRKRMSWRRGRRQPPRAGYRRKGRRPKSSGGPGA